MSLNHSKGSALVKRGTSALSKTGILLSSVMYKHYSGYQSTFSTISWHSYLKPAWKLCHLGSSRLQITPLQQKCMQKLYRSEYALRRVFLHWDTTKLPLSLLLKCFIHFAPIRHNLMTTEVSISPSQCVGSVWEAFQRPQICSKNINV